MQFQKVILKRCEAQTVQSKEIGEQPTTLKCPNKSFLMISPTGIWDHTQMCFDQVFLNVFANPGNDIIVWSLVFRHF